MNRNTLTRLPLHQRFVVLCLVALAGMQLGMPDRALAGPPDVGIVSIVSPAASSVGTLCTLSAVPVTVRVKNFSDEAINSGNIPVSVQLNGGKVFTASSSVFSSIPPGGEQDITIGGFGSTPPGFLLDLSQQPTFTFKATLLVAGDSSIANNSLTIQGTTTTLPETISNTVISSFPYTENFEGGFGAWTNFASCRGPSTFSTGAPSKGTYLTGPGGGASSVFVDRLNFSTWGNGRTRAISPTFDLTGMQFAELNMKVIWESPPPYLNVGGDGATLQTSTDGGVEWDSVGAAGEPYNWFNNGSVTTLQAAGGGLAGWSGYDTSGSAFFPDYSYRTGGSPLSLPYQISGTPLLGSNGWRTAKHLIKGGDDTLIRILWASRPLDGIGIGINGDEGFGFDDFVLSAGPTAPLSVALLSDVDSDGRADPGDTLRYTVVLNNPTSMDLFNSIYQDALTDSGIRLVSGSVTSTQGTVSVGNTNGDTTVSVNVGTFTAGTTVTITYDAVVQPLANGVVTVCAQGALLSDQFQPSSLQTDDVGVSGIADRTCRAAFTDSDNDGVPNGTDLCPGFPETPDADGDGVANACDVCPGGNDLADTDHDGVPNSCDTCPSDASKTTSAGSCGCGFPETDANANNVPDCVDPAANTATDGTCLPGSTDCGVQPLGASACAVVNGYLGQTNILSLSNLKPASLGFTATLIDANGIEKGGFSGSISALKKQDFNVNVLGLVPNTVNTICVSTNATTLGAWSGSVAIYKPNNHNGVSSPIFGATGFDYVLHHPLVNPFRGFGAVAVPLNTFHLGIDPAAQTANYVSLADAARGDGQRLKGTMFYFGKNGESKGFDPVDIPDGGRQDFNGHLALNPPTGNGDAVGSAVFVPVSSGANIPQFFMSETRYFADCTTPGCTDYATAFVVNPRPATANLTAEAVSTLNGETAIVEAVNVGTSSAAGSLSMRGAFGDSLGTASVSAGSHAVVHTIMNKVTTNGVTTGFVPDGTTASAQLTLSSGKLAAQSVFYKLNSFGQLQYAYAVPFFGGGGTSLSAYYNSFIGNKDSSVVLNTTSQLADVNVDYVDFNGSSIFNESFEVVPNGIRQVTSALPVDSYGAMNVTTSVNGVVVNNIIRRDDEYAMCSSGR